MSDGPARVPDNGWQQLIAIIAGQAVSHDLVTVVRNPQERRVIREDITTKEGEESVRYRPVTDEEVERLAENVDGYLVDAGVEPFPRPSAVYLTLPAEVVDMDQLCELVLADPRSPRLVLPSEWAAVLRDLLPRLYRPPGTVD